MPVVFTSQRRRPSRQAVAIVRSTTATPAHDESAVGQLTSKLISARETCASQWHRDLLAQAVTDVRTHNPAATSRRPSPSGGAKSKRRQDAPPMRIPG